MAKYVDLTQEYYFCPVDFEALGAIGEQSRSFITDVGRLITQKSAEPQETEFLRQRLAIAIQRGNSACILETFYT